MIFVYFIALISGVLSGITESINKNITEEKYSSFSYFFLQLFLNGLFFVIPFLLFGSIIKSPIAYVYIFLSAITVLIGNSAIIKAYKTEDISNITILGQTSLIIPILSGIFVLHEKISIYNIIGIAAILLGILIIFYEGRIIKPTSGLLFALINGISFGFFSILQKIASSYTDPISLIFTFNVFVIILLLFIPHTYLHIKPIFKKYYKNIIISRFTNAASFYFIIWAFQRGELSITNTNNRTAFLLSTVLIGIIFLKESKNITKKLLGATFCILGIILLNFF